MKRYAHFPFNTFVAFNNTILLGGQFPDNDNSNQLHFFNGPSLGYGRNGKLWYNNKMNGIWWQSKDNTIFTEKGEQTSMNT